MSSSAIELSPVCAFTGNLLCRNLAATLPAYTPCIPAVSLIGSRGVSVRLRSRMQCRLVVHENELSVVLRLRDLEQLQEALRSARAHPTPFPRQVSMEP